MTERTSTETDQVLSSVLADLWADAWRRGQTTSERLRIFRRRVETQLYFATGLDLVIRNREEGR